MTYASPVPAKLTEEAARAVMIAAGSEPLEPYRGTKVAWLCRCAKCDRESAPKLETIKQGGSCSWCFGRHVDPGAARALMVAAGIEPLVDYPGSNVPWPCRCLSCDREVKPRYSSIRRGQRGCGWCAGHHVDPVFAEATMLAAMLQPTTPYPGAMKRWPCACMTCGRDVNPTYNQIQQGGGGCGWCARTRVDPGDAVTAMIEAGLQPLEPYPGSNRQPWRCRCLTCDREVTPAYSRIQQGQGGCAYCGGNRVDPDEASAFMIASGIQPNEPYPGRHTPWNCSCATCGRAISPTYGSVRRGSGCAWCAGKRVDPDEAALVMIKAGLEPLEPYPGTGIPWRCRCVVCERETTPVYSGFQQGRGGCVWCARRRVDPSEALDAMLAAGMEPLEPYPGTNTAWRCRCLTCHRIISPTYSSVDRGSGCAWCAGLRVDPDDAVTAMLGAGLRPLEPYPGSGSPWRCECLTCKREVNPAYGAIKQGQGGCVYCAGRRVDVEEAVQTMIKVGLQPLEPFPGSGTPWRCRCLACNRVSTPAYTNVRMVGSGCRFCAPMGIDYAAPGVLYLLSHPEYFAVKIGVTTTTARMNRVGQHELQGWRVEGVWSIKDAASAKELEQLVIRWWRRDLGAPLALTKSEMPHGGHSETAALIHVDIDDTINRITRLIAEL